MRGACAGHKASCWVCPTSSERSESVNWFLSLFLFLFREHLNNRKIYQNPEASPNVLSALFLALTVHSKTLPTSLLWKDVNIGCSVELIAYFHQEEYSSSPYPSVHKRASGILLIVPLSDGSFLVALHFLNGIASIHSNKIRYSAKIVFVVTINKTISKLKNITSMWMSIQIFQITLKCSPRVKEKRPVALSVYIYGCHILSCLYTSPVSVLIWRCFYFCSPYVFLAWYFAFESKWNSINNLVCIDKLPKASQITDCVH